MNKLNRPREEDSNQRNGSISFVNDKSGPLQIEGSDNNMRTLLSKVDSGYGNQQILKLNKVYCHTFKLSHRLKVEDGI